jgi:hypothetical protein
MLKAMILTLIVDTLGMGSDDIKCNFPGNESTDKPIQVVLNPRPSLKDQPGLFRVIMEMNGAMSVRAAAQPIDSTTDRDIIIRGRTAGKSIYTIGLRDDGNAALNMKTRRADDPDVHEATRVGTCRNYQEYIDRWLSS